jgi:hypothetical protein
VGSSFSTKAYPPFLRKAQKFGAKDCTFCHTQPTGGEGWNERGNWLIAEKERRKADAVDVEWLADYKEGANKVGEGAENKEGAKKVGEGAENKEGAKKDGEGAEDKEGAKKDGEGAEKKENKAEPKKKDKKDGEDSEKKENKEEPKKKEKPDGQ